MEPGLTPRAWLKMQAFDVRRWVWLSALLGVVAGLLTVVQMGLVAWLVSQVIVAGRTPGEMLGMFASLGLVILARGLAQCGQESAGLETGIRVRARARAALLDHLAALGPVRLGAWHSGGLGGQLLEQIEALDGYFARFLPQLRIVLLLPVAILLVVFWLDWLAALFLLFAAPLIPLFMALVGMGAERLNREQFAAVTRLAGHFLDRVRGLTTLQLFNHAERSADEVVVAADEYRRRSMRTLRVAFLSSAVLEFFASVAIAAVAIYIGFGLLGYIRYGPAEELTLFSGLFILLLAPDFFQPLRNLAQHYHDRAAALGAADGLVALLNEPIPARHEEAETGKGTALVSLAGVSVSHPGRGRVLGPLDLHVTAGAIVALVGSSGAGKSTLLQLIAGFIAPDAGRVTGASTAGFAWMDQRPFLIQGTIADNLRLVAPEADDSALLAALDRVGLGALLGARPEGLSTPLGERGAGLSGGQAQRLALARVFLSPAPLVLLDEPTASLDEASEAWVIEALRYLAGQGRTLVIATHHPAVMALAHRVIRLEQGRVVSQGAP